MALPPSLKEPSQRQQLKKMSFIALRVVLAIVIGLFISQVKLDYIESLLYDLRVRYKPTTSPSGNIALILINSNSVERLKGPPGFPEHTEMLSALSRSNPKAVLYDLNLAALKGTEEQKRSFATTTQFFTQFYVLTDEMEMRGEEGKLKLLPPLDKIPLTSGPKSADRVNFAKDGVTRRMVISYQDKTLAHYMLASQMNAQILDRAKIRGKFDFFDTEQAYIHFRPAQTYPTYLFSDVIEGKISPELMKDKIVIIGQDLGLKEDEYIMTPYSREVVAMTTTEMHANMIDTLIQNNSPVKTHPYWNMLFTVLISILTVQVVFSLRPGKGLIILVSTFAAFMTFSYLLFWLFDVWIIVANPLLSIFLSYYFFIPYRLIIENRRSWEYYQKNKILKQVEELKTNFISMMSHDLKTPIARIQGMIDVILRGPHLSDPQREAIDTIKQSNEDLLKFINSILNYAKIESQGVQLQKQSKDINQLIIDVIKKHEFLAQIKKIEVKSELEPLFPISVDPDLMKQILSNLVENAIKYSPENTAIFVSSAEVSGQIVIQVKDQGPGISRSDLPHIFMKFFRSQNAKSSPVKGSGLGLYLAKYFTELHQGRIEVESPEGQGCLFTVYLPVQTNMLGSSDL